MTDSLWDDDEDDEGVDKWGGGKRVIYVDFKAIFGVKMEKLKLFSKDTNHAYFDWNKIVSCT